MDFFNEFWSAVVTLFILFDPLGNLPIFVTELKNVEESKHMKILVTEMTIALAILVVFFFSGKFILQAFDISVPSMTLAGAVILFIIALKMIFRDTVEDEKTPKNTDGPFIVPLAVPCIAGPSVISWLIICMAKAPEKWYIWLCALLASWLLSSLILINAGAISRLLGDKALIAIERLMGMLLIALAIDMFIRGIPDIIKMVQI